MTAELAENVPRRRRRRTAKGNTPRKGPLRIEDELWEATGIIADLREDDRSDIARRAYLAYCRRYASVILTTHGDELSPEEEQLLAKFAKP
jgi:hypothetical protein